MWELGLAQTGGGNALLTAVILGKHCQVRWSNRTERYFAHTANSLHRPSHYQPLTAKVFNTVGQFATVVVSPVTLDKICPMMLQGLNVSGF